MRIERQRWTWPNRRLVLIADTRRRFLRDDCYGYGPTVAALLARSPLLVPDETCAYHLSMCNRARFAGEPADLFGSAKKLFPERPRDNRFNPQELRPKGRAYVIREQDGERGWDIMSWDVLGGQAAWPMTNVRNLKLPQWRKLAADPSNRCLVPLTEFCEWTPEKHDLGDGKPAIKGEMWFSVTDQPTFAVAGFWQQTVEGSGFTMVTCDPNELVAPIHPKAMITILRPDDCETWLHGSYDEVVALQRPYAAAAMTVRGPVFPTRSKSTP